MGPEPLRESRRKEFPGKIYFGQKACGVLFFRVGLCYNKREKTILKEAELSLRRPEFFKKRRPLFISSRRKGA